MRVTKAYCDICGAEVPKEKAERRAVPVLVNVFDESGEVIEQRILPTTMDACDDCFDRIVTLEMDRGPNVLTPNLRWRNTV